MKKRTDCQPVAAANPALLGTQSDGLRNIITDAQGSTRNIIQPFLSMTLKYLLSDLDLALHRETVTVADAKETDGRTAEDVDLARRSRGRRVCHLNEARRDITSK
jgi:hypothetical protein